MIEKIECLNESYSTTRLCYKLLDDGFLDKNGKIKEELKFKINISEFNIVDSKILAKDGEKFDTYLFLPEGEGRKGEGGLRTKGCFKFSYKKGIRDKGQGIRKDEENVCGVVDENDNLIEKINFPSNELIPYSSYASLPLITIITVVYNGEKYLEETIQSVINQSYPNVEYIIIDGVSTDGTLDIIKKYEDYIDYWVSEKDKGIYDAMNKGIDLASGKWINFMNAGDRFYEEKVLEKIFSKKDFKNIDIIYGKHHVIYHNRTRIAKAGDIKNLWRGSQFSHQSVFISSYLHKKNKYNILNRIGADFEFFYKAYRNGKKFYYIDAVVSSVSAGGVSDINRVESIVGWWNVVDKSNKVNLYYIFLILKEIFKEKIKKAINGL